MILLLLFVPLSLGRAAEALPAAAPVKISEQIFGQTLFSATRFAAKPSEFVVGWVGGALQGARRFSTLNAAGLGDLMTLLPSYHEERLEVNGKEVGTGRYTFAWGKFHFLDFDERYASAQGGAQMGLIFGLTSPLFQPMWAEMVPVLRTFSMGGRAIKGIESLSNKLISGSGEIISTAYSVTVFGLVGTGLSMSVDSLGLAGTPLGVLKNEFVNMVISVIVAPTAGRAPRIAFTKAYGRVHGVGAEIPVLGARTVSHDQVAFAEAVRGAQEGNRGLDFDGGSLSREEVRQLFGTTEEVVVTALLDQGQHEGVRETWREYQSRPEEEGFADLPNYPLEMDGAHNLKIQLTDHLMDTVDRSATERILEEGVPMDLFGENRGTHVGERVRLQDGTILVVTDSFARNRAEEYAGSLSEGRAQTLLDLVEGRISTAPPSVIPAKAGIQNLSIALDSRFRGNDGLLKGLKITRDALKAKVDTYGKERAENALMKAEKSFRSPQWMTNGSRRIVTDLETVSWLESREKTGNEYDQKAATRRKVHLANLGVYGTKSFYEKMARARESGSATLQEKAAEWVRYEQNRVNKTEKAIGEKLDKLNDLDQKKSDLTTESEKEILIEEIALERGKLDIYGDLLALAEGKKTYSQVMGSWGARMRDFARRLGIPLGETNRPESLVNRLKLFRKGQIRWEIQSIRHMYSFNKGSREESILNRILARLRKQLGGVDGIPLVSLLNQMESNARGEADTLLKFSDIVKSQKDFGNVEELFDRLVEKMSQDSYIQEDSTVKDIVKKTAEEIIRQMQGDAQWRKWGESLDAELAEKMDRLIQWDPSNPLSRERHAELRNEIAHEVFGRQESDLTLVQKLFMDIKLSEAIFYKNRGANSSSAYRWSPEQIEMVVNNLLGRISALETGAGKTYAFFWSLDLHFHIHGKGTAEYIAAKITDAQQITSADRNRQLTNALGIETYSGRDLYDRGLDKLTEIYNQKIEDGSRGKVVTYDLTTRGFVELNARMANDGGRLNEALDLVTVRIADEADVASLSRDALVLGSGDSVASKDFVDHIETIVSRIEEIKKGQSGIEFRVVRGDEKLKDMEFTMKDDDLIYSETLHAALVRLGKEIKKETGNKYTEHEIDAQIDHIFRARARLDGSEKGEGMTWLHGQGTSVEAGVLRRNTTDQSASYNVSLVLWKIRAIEREHGKETQESRSETKRLSLDKYNVKLSESIGESTIPQVFSRNAGAVLTFGGSATMDISREIARATTGSDPVEVDGSVLEKAMDPNRHEIHFQRREEVISSEAARVVEMLKGGEKNYREVLGAKDPSYLKDVLIRALRILAQEKGVNGYEFDHFLKGLKGESLDSLEAIKNRIAWEYGIKEANLIEIIDAKTAESQTKRVSDIAENKSGDESPGPRQTRVILTNESGLRGVNFQSINIRILDGHNFSEGDLLQAVGRAGRPGSANIGNFERTVYLDRDSVDALLIEAKEIDNALRAKNGKRLFVDMRGGKELVQLMDQYLQKGGDHLTPFEKMKLSSKLRSLQLKSASIWFKANTEALYILLKEPIAGLLTKAKRMKNKSDVNLLEKVYQEVIEHAESKIRSSLEKEGYQDAESVMREIFENILGRAQEVFERLDRGLVNSDLRTEIGWRLLDLKSVNFERMGEEAKSAPDLFRKATFAGAARDVGVGRSPARDVAKVLIALSAHVLPSKGGKVAGAKVLAETVKKARRSVGAEKSEELQKVLENDRSGLVYEKSDGTKALTELGERFVTAYIGLASLSLSDDEKENFIAIAPLLGVKGAAPEMDLAFRMAQEKWSAASVTAAGLWVRAGVPMGSETAQELVSAIESSDTSRLSVLTDGSNPFVSQWGKRLQSAAISGEEFKYAQRSRNFFRVALAGIALSFHQWRQKRSARRLERNAGSRRNDVPLLQLSHLLGSATLDFGNMGRNSWERVKPVQLTFNQTAADRQAIRNVLRTYTSQMADKTLSRFLKKVKMNDIVTASRSKDPDAWKNFYEKYAYFKFDPDAPWLKWARPLASGVAILPYYHVSIQGVTALKAVTAAIVGLAAIPQLGWLTAVVVPQFAILKTLPVIGALFGAIAAMTWAQLIAMALPGVAIAVIFFGFKWFIKQVSGMSEKIYQRSDPVSYAVLASLREQVKKKREAAVAEEIGKIDSQLAQELEQIEQFAPQMGMGDEKLEGIKANRTAEAEKKKAEIRRT
ncbi:MAG: UbiA prenyltransferase family protein, partial [Elusimicrobia bacterium]|nr:UbiA prenyltransferase family protein [Elusimicrobiota bacterium]